MPFPLSPDLASRLQLLPDPSREDVAALRSAAEAGDPAAQAILAEFALFGRAGVPHESEKAMERLKALAEAGEPHALVLLGDALRRGHWFTARDPDAARACYRRAAEAGSLEAEALLHVVAYELDPDSPGTIPALQALADRGSHRALTALGHAAYDGRGGEADDPAKALRHYRAAADAGDPFGALNLAGMHQGGCEPDPEVVHGHLVRAADRGCAEASYRLAVHHLDMDSPGYDRMEGVRRLSQASGVGHVPALFLMGAAHLTGRPGRTDPEAAERCLRAAHELGHKTAVEWLVRALIHLQRFEEAAGLARSALETEDASTPSADLRTNLGVLLELGLGVFRDADEAARLYREAAALGDPEAGFALAMLAAEGPPGREASVPDAAGLSRVGSLLWTRVGPGGVARPARGVAALVTRYGALLDAGQVEALYGMLAHAVDSPEEQALLHELARIGRKLGNVPLGASLGWHLVYGIGCPEDLPGGLAVLRWAARRGNAGACRVLGDLYTDGQGVSRSRRRALAWYRRAGEGGVGAVWLSVGHAFHTGRGVRRDPAEALRWYERAIADGDANAMVNAALLLSVDRGLERDYPRALALLKRAAGLGQPDAPAQIGYMHLKGLGVPKDAVEAARWYGQAAEAGHPNALTALAVLHRTGRGVRKDRDLALEFLRRAVEQGYRPAIRALREWTARGTARQAA